jgi:hypothetical protein
MAYRTRRKRRQDRGAFKIYKPKWIDPYPGIPGTEPEKRVFAELRSRGIYFIYQGQVPEFEQGHPMYFLAPAGYKPDFILPEYRLIIDPFGAFHHSLPEAAKRDEGKITRYAAAGYAYYHPWWGVAGIPLGDWLWTQTHNIVRHPDARRIQKKGGIRNLYGNIKRSMQGVSMSTSQMLNEIPELRMGPRHNLTDPRDIKAKQNPGYRIGQYVGAGANSVGAANRKRAKPKSLNMKVSAFRR